MFQAGPQHFNEQAGRRREFFFLEFPPHFYKITVFERNSHLPAGIRSTALPGEDLPGERRLNDLESERRRRFADQFHATLGRADFFYRFLERIQIQLRLEGTLQIAAEKELAGEGKLRIPQVLNARPGDGAEYQDDDPGDPVAADHRLEQRENRHDAADAVEEYRCPARG